LEKLAVRPFSSDCDNALRGSLLVLGISVTYDPDKKEGGIKVSPLCHFHTAVQYGASEIAETYFN
jgi:hypothetical protein